MMLRTLSTVLIAALIPTCFCPLISAQEKKITRARLPAAVEKTVARESEGATITGFAKESEHGQTFYEATLVVNGRRKEILLDKNGEIVEIEDEVSLDSLPASVQQALMKAAGSGTIVTIESLTKSAKLVAYEAHVKHGRKMSEIQVGPNGERLKQPE
jgi:uncharacterized membrane protein YkoI